MIILDTDHFSVLKDDRRELAQTLSLNLNISVDQEFATTAVTLEEQFRGWLAFIHGSADVDHQLPAYKRLC